MSTAMVGGQTGVEREHAVVQKERGEIQEDPLLVFVIEHFRRESLDSISYSFAEIFEELCQDLASVLDSLSIELRTADVPFKDLLIFYDRRRAMKKSVKVSVLVGLIGVAMVLGLTMTASANRGNGELGTVYVTSQELYFDTFVSAQVLPNRGPFQKLEDGVTEYGPGDRGYVGGRWWIDDGDGVREDEDTFLLCPLLGPGRDMP